MEPDKKLDYDAPLLSIRRFSAEPATNSPYTPSTTNSSTAKPVSRRSSLPFYKPDIKSGPVRHPGVVPFVWEQRPGEPKPGPASPARPPLAAPRPPPAKLGSSVRTRKPVRTNVPDSASETMAGSSKKDGGFTREEGELDRHREQTPPERIEVHSSTVLANGGEGEKKEGQKQEDNGVKIEKKKEEQKQEEEEEEEDNFSDALDTLSRTESFFMNCSVSGLSGLPTGPAETPPCDSDLEAREFMMDRFLPAAQAVATGSPQYTFRKVPAKPIEQTNQAMDQNLRRKPMPLPFQNQPKYMYVNGNGDDLEEQGEEEDDYEEDFEDSRRFYSKGCGFLPSFCMKGSFLLMNPVPGMKQRGRVPPPRGVRKNASPLIRSSINGHNSDEAFDNYMHSWEPVYKHKQEQSHQPYCEINNEMRNKLNSETSQLTYWSDSPTANGSSPFQESKGGNGQTLSQDEKSSKSNVSDLLVASVHSSRHGSNGSLSPSLDRNHYSDAQDSIPSEMESNVEKSEERENMVKKKDLNPLLLPVLPLPLPKSPTESWLSHTLNNKKQHATMDLSKDSEVNKPSRTRQLRFAEVIQKPLSGDTGI